MSEAEEHTTPGASALLVAARESLGLSQKEVADKLYLTTTFIRYIDAGEFDRIPKPAFVKGYLRSYARTVNLSGDEIVALYEAEQKAQVPEPEIRGVTEENVSSSAITGPVLQTGMIGLGGLVVVVALVWWLVSEPEAPPPTVSQPSVQAPERPEPQQEDFDFVTPDSNGAEVTNDQLQEETRQDSIAPATATSTTAAQDFRPEEVTGLADVQVAEAEDPPVDDNEEPEVASQGEPEEIRFERTTDGNRSYVTVDAGGFDQLELSFTDECWVEVEDDARGLVYYDLNRDGDVLTVYGTAPFEILLGKATGVEMIYNGRPLDVGPYISQDNTAKLTVSE